MTPTQVSGHLNHYLLLVFRASKKHSTFFAQKNLSSISLLLRSFLLNLIHIWDHLSFTIDIMEGKLLYVPAYLSVGRSVRLS